MDIGIQRDTRVYLKGCDWGQLICRTGRFLTAQLFTLFIMITSAQAAVESVPPISGGTTWINSYSESFPSAEAACLGLRDPYTYRLFYPSDKYAFMGTVPNLAYPTVWQDCLWTYLPTGESFRGGSVRPVADAVCPIPTVNPDIKYVYRITTGKCERTVPDPCPIDPLPPIPTDDSCAQSLHAGSGVDVRAACPQISDTLKSQLQCFANKIIATNVTAKPSISYSGPTATIRNVNYQTHLLFHF